VPETPVEWGFNGAKLMMWDVPGEVIKAKRPLPTHEDWHTDDVFSNPEFRATVEKVRENSDEFLARHGYVREGHRYRVVRPNRERIAVFCHLGFGLTWLSQLLDIPVTLMWSSFWMAPTSVTTILFDERTGEFATPRVIGMADVSHLHAANLPTQPAGIKANFH
jgi:probable phosphoglycerate mutase